MPAALVLKLIFLAAFAYGDEDWGGGEFDPRGKVVGHEFPDFDPIHENLGPVVGYTADHVPIYQKTGATYGPHPGNGNVTGHTLDGDPLYDGGKALEYTPDGDRVTPLRKREQEKKGFEWM